MYYDYSDKSTWNRWCNVAVAHRRQTLERPLHRNTKCSRIKFRLRSVSGVPTFLHHLYRIDLTAPPFVFVLRPPVSRFRSSLAIRSLKALDYKFRHLWILIHSLGYARTTNDFRHGIFIHARTCNLHACCANAVNISPRAALTNVIRGKLRTRERLLSIFVIYPGISDGDKRGKRWCVTIIIDYMYIYIYIYRKRYVNICNARYSLIG